MLWLVLERLGCEIVKDGRKMAMLRDIRILRDEQAALSAECLSHLHIHDHVAELVILRVPHPPLSNTPKGASMRVVDYHDSFEQVVLDVGRRSTLLKSSVDGT